MLGTRGVRLGVMEPEVYEMQVRAIARAAVAVCERTGRGPHVEIVIPLVANERFSFGTNDLTQCGLGFSRDDIEGRIIPRYIEEKIVDGSPFGMIDRAGVGGFVRAAVGRGWRERCEFVFGVCGGRGGDFGSIRFLLESGLGYVSCLLLLLSIARGGRRAGGGRWCVVGVLS